MALQLKGLSSIIHQLNTIEPIPFYEQLKFRADTYINSITQELQVDSEQNIVNFIDEEIAPLFKHIRGKDQKLDALITKYENDLDPVINTIYRYRKAYDESVLQINKKMATLLDQKQEEAQKIYPHYFERFKSDGVEHNMYIGESITQQNSFNEVYLYNLRLWKIR